MSVNVAAHNDSSSVGARLSVMMFLQFFLWGGWYVTIGNYMKAHGMESNIPWAYSVGPIAAIISPFFLGMVADRFFSTERILAVMHLIGGGVLLALPSVDAGMFKILLLVHMLCYMPTLGLTNSLAFHNVTNAEKQFPIIRVFGTIGWIVAGLIVSLLLHADTKPIQFYVAGGAGVLLGLYSLTLPHTPPPSWGRETTIHDILGLDSIALMKNRSFATFMISSFLICIPLAFYYAYAPVFVGDIGIADPASKMSLGQFCEVGFMLVMPFFFARLGVKWMLFVGMFAWVARYGLFAAASTNPLLPLVLAGIILHGACYDFFFVTGQIYVDKKASSAIRGQAQGFLVLVTQGVGMLIGAQAAGIIHDHYKVGETVHWQMVWLIPCITAGVIMLAFAALFRDDTQVPESEFGREIGEVPPASGPVEAAPAP
jgi:nucleoside transporter